MANSQLTIDSIIKKYQQRQEKLIHSLVLDQIGPNDTHRHQHLSNCHSGIDTPQFSASTNRKEIAPFQQNTIGKTHKKKDFSQSPNPGNTYNPYSQVEYEKLLQKLDQTEEKLAKSERNYAQIWRKYQLLLKDSKKSEKSIQLQHKLRGKESNELYQRLVCIEKENSSLKQCIRAKENHLEALRDKLKQKNQRIIETQRELESVRSQLSMMKSKQIKNEEGLVSQKVESQQLTVKLKQQLSKLSGLVNGKEEEKKALLIQIQKIYSAHRQELEILRLSYSTVEEQYKQWIQDCKAQKLKIIRQYEQKLREITIESNQNLKSDLQQNSQLISKNKQIQQITASNIRFLSQLQRAKSDLQLNNKVKQELILKVSSLQNSLLDKLDLKNYIQEAQRRLKDSLAQEEAKNKELRQRYNNLNTEYLQLKEKHSLLLEEVEEQKCDSRKENYQIIRLKKEIALCREQLEKSRNNQITLTNKLNQTITVLKKKNSKFQEENHQLMTELMAERLESARLRQQVDDTKTFLKREYELSLQNTRKELETQIKEIGRAGCVDMNVNVQKEQIYLQLRQLQRRYQLLASEVVRVDEVIGMAGKMQRRYQNRK